MCGHKGRATVGALDEFATPEDRYERLGTDRKWCTVIVVDPVRVAGLRLAELQHLLRLHDNASHAS